jgi:hypothetical protein
VKAFIALILVGTIRPNIYKMQDSDKQLYL